MSAPEPLPRMRAAGVTLAACAADIIEVAAFRDGVSELVSRAQARGLPLPQLGQAAAAGGGLVLAVRPGRWLLVLPATLSGSNALKAQEICGAAGAAIELSSGLAALHLTGPAVRETLKRGCRLDLDPVAFPSGAAAASAMAQVAVTVAALPSGVMLLTPATTAQHLCEWLASSARPFGFQRAVDVNVTVLSGEQPS